MFYGIVFDKGRASCGKPKQIKTSFEKEHKQVQAPENWRIVAFETCRGALLAGCGLVAEHT